MDYVLAVQAPAFGVSEDLFVTDDPFAKHILELRYSLPPEFKRLILFAPEMHMSAVQSLKGNVTSIDAKTHNIIFMPSHKLDDSVSYFWLRRAYQIRKQAKLLFSNESVVHVDLSTDVRRPMTAIVARVARQKRRPVCFVTDIDFREHASRARTLGETTHFSYALAKAQQHFKTTQVRNAVANSQLVLLKSPSMVRDFGRNATHVKNFFDVVHAADDVLDSKQESKRLKYLLEIKPLRLCYFGRLVKYKGIERMIAAIAIARDDGVDIEFRIVGDGPEYANLSDQVRRLDLEAHVIFKPAAPYGSALFNEIDECHAMVNAPLREDTPRAAFDAMARGLPILAFDISYFRDLSEQSGAVMLASWPDVVDLAAKAITLSRDREILAELAANGLKFARKNTQSIWLKKRVEWLLDFASVIEQGENRDCKVE